MSTSDSTAFAKEALSRLNASQDSVAWPERRDIAAKLGHILATTAPNEFCIALAGLLADDPKPEVRKEVAEALVHLPDDDFVKLAAKLGEDSNAFVKTAAERAIVRRRRSAQQNQRTRRNLGAVQTRMSAFESVYGPAATKEARRIADEQYGTLVQQTHHDIRNILSPVKTSISSLLKQFEGQRPNSKFCTENLVEMARRLDYMERFLNDMKEYAKASSAERRRERLAEIVNEAQAMALGAMRSARTPVDPIKLTIKIPETITVCVARHQLLMAVVHLITNAFESFAMQAKRKSKQEVLIEAKADPTSIMLIVADTGPGIHADDLEILREFAPGKKSEKPNGTGFGLPTAARYAILQGGSLKLESTQGKGTSVVITLPIECEDDEE